MTKPKTSASKLAANERYEQKLKRKNVIFKTADDADLISVIENDNAPFTPLVKSLLREHYKLNGK